VSNPITGPDDDENYGHGGVEVPVGNLDTLPQVVADDAEEGDSDAPSPA
jgi:hypothetical protein